MNPEIGLLLVALLGAAAVGRRLRPPRSWNLAPLSRRPAVAVLFCALLPVAARLALLPLYPPPEPRLHDEFSFLLGADTLAHGRLANPPHPHWVHFESMHMLTRPTYASAFPPGQAAALALGRTVFGHPWAGVLLSNAAMCGAVCWMLLGWVPPRWALAGTLLVVFRIAVSSYWMNSYYGGALAAAGGALATGALGRIVRARQWRSAWWMSAGFVILAFTRTVEGAWLACIIVTTLTAVLRAKALRLALPLGLAAVTTAAGIAAWSRTVTGNPLRPPYALYRATQTMAPHFVWQAPRPEPLYNNRVMRHFYVGLEMDDYRHARRYAVDLFVKAASYWRFYAGPLLLIPFLALPLVRRRREARVVAIAGALFAPILLAEVWHNPHYAAPALGLGVTAIALGMRALACQHRTGLSFVRLTVILCGVMLCVRVLAGPGTASWRWPVAEGLERAAALRRLEALDGQHLVLVRYGPRHDPGNEWVYNGADIDSGKVVWARELDPASNARLIEYFRVRAVWLAEPDEPSRGLIPYERAEPRPMPFVAVGAPGIAAIRDPGEVRRRVLESAGGGEFACDGWNYHFTRATGVAGPDVSRGCYAGGGRAHTVAFERWWAWLLAQHE